MTHDIDPAGLAALIALRRDLHAHPELGFEEARTSAMVADALRACGCDVQTGIGGTGVVGTLRCGEGNRAIALRADMDALAMTEAAEGRPHASRTPGRMHACGHDGHTVMLLGAAQHLARRRNFSGTVHFIFQPAEEGLGGAKAMLADGLFARFPADRVYGLHNMPNIPVGQIAVVQGPQLAASDRWEVSFTGQGTHGAKPHLGQDVVTAAGAFLAALHSIVARQVDPLHPAVISACAVETGNFAALNVIPDSARIGGTARSFDAGVRDLIEGAIGQLAHGIAATYGLRAAYEYRRGMPPVINVEAPTAIAQAAADRALGHVMTAFPPSSAGDDFAELAAVVPGCYVWLGNGPAADGALHHSTRYDFNDDAIAPGVAFWSELVETDLAL
ncbi:amidohydrolase [Roseicitreum antarcticum]|uniref:Hippurate hydrolase n=1 Tax=Roseicitreum antarcticum TaxID=564137 RepID=A0A1H2TQ00_9RHOB|nr:amidohydrolase [Roseicitreum antarcticum]SDW45980.1 hippurate hydrolase [Roseicitreum antarcticum]